MDDTPEDVVLPDRRKPGWYEDLTKKLDEHAETLESRFARFMRGALIAFAIIGVLSTGALIGFGFLLAEVGDQADDIQQQRYESVFRSCDEQNKRHDNTIAEFHKVEQDALERYPKRAAEIKQSVKSNLNLIEALVPKQDCDRLAALAVDAKKTKKK